MTSRLVPGAIGATVLAFVLAACGGAAVHPPSRAELSAIRAVRASRQGAGIAGQFPRTPSAVACVIEGGGPYPGVRVPGRCETQVEAGGDGGVLVRFVETWDGHDFRGQGSSARAGLVHTWEFTVAPGGHVAGPLSYGDFPPQLVK